MADLSEEELAAAQKHMEECGLGGGNTTWLYYDLRLMLAEIRRLRAALAERDELLGKVLPVLEPFAREAEFWIDDRNLSLHVCECQPEQEEALFSLNDLHRAASLASELKEKQP